LIRTQFSLSRESLRPAGVWLSLSMSVSQRCEQRRNSAEDWCGVSDADGWLL
jgi:hypothetical protein